jgi:hypothetical protein
MASDPVLRWLALDGYEFRRHYFNSEESLNFIRRLNNEPVERIRTQGAGRAMWFTQCADIKRIGLVSQTVPEKTRGDLWSGVGLACGYASVSSQDDFDLTFLPAKYSRHFLQGLVFAGAAHSQSGRTPEKTSLLLREALGIDAGTAMLWADEALVDMTAAGQGPSGFLIWQERIQNRCLKNFRGVRGLTQEEVLQAN